MEKYPYRVVFLYGSVVAEVIVESENDGENEDVLILAGRTILEHTFGVDDKFFNGWDAEAEGPLL